MEKQVSRKSCKEVKTTFKTKELADQVYGQCTECTSRQYESTTTIVYNKVNSKNIKILTKTVQSKKF